MSPHQGLPPALLLLLRRAGAGLSPSGALRTGDEAGSATAAPDGRAVKAGGRHGEARQRREGGGARPEQEAEEAPEGVRGGAPLLRQVSAPGAAGGPERRGEGWRGAAEPSCRQQGKAAPAGCALLGGGHQRCARLPVAGVFFPAW